MYEQELLTAVKRGDIKAVESLIAKGANIEVKDKNSWDRTPLLLAAGYGHQDVVQVLLNSSANTDARDKERNNALILALLLTGKRELINLLLTHGMVFDSSLHQAVYENDLETINNLLSKNLIEVDRVDSANNTALQYAAALGNIPVLKLLAKHKAKINHQDNAGTTALQYAAHNGYTNTLEWLLAHGASLTEKNNNGATALLVAASQGHTNIVEWLLVHGASLSEKDNCGDTALLLAAFNGHTSTVEWLLVHGASLNEKDNYGYTALLLAAVNGHTSTVEWLLAHGASLIEKNNNGATGLLLAAMNGDTSTVEWLLSHGASINEKSNNGTTALHIAALGGHTNTAECLVKHGAKLTETTEKGNTPLLLAVRNGHFGMVEWLLAHGASVKEEYRWIRKTPLLLAAKQGHINIIELLLNHGSSITEENLIWKTTALLYAAKYGHIDTVKWLLNHGSSLKEKNLWSQSALLLAAGKGHIDMLVWLLKNGFSLAEKDNGGKTALLCAAEKGQIKMVEWLLEHGASLAEKDNGGKTALLLAAYNGRTGTVEWLVAKKDASLTEKDNDGDTALLLAALNGCTSTIEWLLSNGASLLERGAHGNTALICAAWNGCTNTVKLLLEKGASISEKNENGYTALLLAAEQGQIETVDLLLNQGASINERGSKFGNTALISAAHSGQIDMVAWLLKHGASLTERDITGRTPLICAANNGQIKMVEWLLEHGASLAEKDNEGYTVLLEVVCSGQIKMVKWLLEHGASLAEKNNYGNTALLLAAANGHIDMVEWLLENGASLLEENLSKNNALHLAAFYNHIIMVEWLLGHNCPFMDENGVTPLHAAAVNGHTQMVAWLIAHGFSIAGQDNYGNTALWNAARNGHKDTAAFLAARSAYIESGLESLILADIYQAIQQAYRNQSAEFEKILQQITTQQINELNIAGDWLTTERLQKLTACIKANQNIKECLIGEQIIKARQEDQFYLQGRFIDFSKAKKAAMAANIDTLLTLTQPAQPLFAVLGHSALHIAAYVNQTALIKPLIEQGVSIELKNKQGKTALQIARENNHYEFVKNLVTHQEAIALKRLQEEAIQAKHGAIAFAERQRLFQEDIYNLLNLKAQNKNYGKILLIFWQALIKLSMQKINVNFLKPPALLLRHQDFSFTEKIWLTFNKNQLTREHPMFENIYDIIQQLKMLITAPLKPIILQLIGAYQDYIDLVCNSSEIEKEHLYVHQTLLVGFQDTVYILKREVGEILTNIKKQDGQHGHSVVHQIGNIHFKLNPHAPGIEYMVSSLGNMIAGQGATPTELLKVITLQGYPRIYLASKTVRGKELESLIKHHSELIAKIRPDNFSAMVILSLLTNPQDGKADNYMVEFKQDGSVEILGIDNDIAFAEPMIKEYVTTQEGKEIKCYFVNVKNVLYFFPQMKQSIDKEFREAFLKRVPEILLIEWLSLLHEKNQDYQRLLEQGVFSKEEFSGTAKTGKGLQLPIKLAPGAIKILYQKLIKLRELLSGNPTITLQEIFSHIQPQLAKHYGSVQVRYPDDILRCVKVLYEESIEDAKELEVFKKASPEEQSWMMTESVIKTTTKLGFESERIEPIERSIIEFLKVIKYEQLTSAMAAIIYEALQSFKFLYPDSTLLHLAVKENNINLVWFLIKHNLLNVNVRDKTNKTALQQALTEEKFMMVNSLVKQGAILEGKDKKYQDKPLLHWVVQQKKFNLAESLLQNKLIDIDDTNNLGYTALHIAASMGEIEMVQQLLYYGANANKQDIYQRSAIDKVTTRLTQEKDINKIELLQKTLSLLQFSSSKTKKQLTMKISSQLESEKENLKQETGKNQAQKETTNQIWQESKFFLENLSVSTFFASEKEEDAKKSSEHTNLPSKEDSSLLEPEDVKTKALKIACNR